MKKIHVCLVSKQTIPNVLAIHEKVPDFVYFISTDMMEEQKKTEAIIACLKLNGLDYQNRHRVVRVNQDSFQGIVKAIGPLVEDIAGEEVTVNLTCGNKLMSIAAFSVFEGTGATLMYTPIPRNEYIVVDDSADAEEKCHPLPLRLDVRSYITAYGVRVSNAPMIWSMKERAKRARELSGWIVDHYEDLENLLGAICYQLNKDDARNRQNYTLSMTYAARNPSEKTLMKHLGGGSGRIEKRLDKLEIGYLTGDWLSDYCYTELVKLKVDDCVTGIELIDKNGNPNEFDVMFTKDNALYIIECKSLKQTTDKNTDILYKIGALQDNFGLRVNSFLVSTSRQQILDRRQNIKEHLLKRAKLFRTEIVHPSSIPEFRKWIQTKVKGL